VGAVVNGGVEAGEEGEDIHGTTAPTTITNNLYTVFLLLLLLLLGILLL
jgi:hypothetical protein